jgi:hypothetical protein
VKKLIVDFRGNMFTFN